MNKELAMEWVQALRSGKYRQGRKRLKSKDGDYCCLGVLADLNGYSEEDLSRMVVLDPNAICGLRTLFGSVKKEGNPNKRIQLQINGFEEVFEDLACANDKGATFEQIADFIEQNYEDL